MDFTKLLSIALGAILVENFVLVKLLGIGPFLGASKKISTSLGMGAAVTFVMGLSSAVAWTFNTYLLVPLRLEYLRTVVFVLIIAVLVQLVEMFLKKVKPTLHSALGIYLPLVTTNCAVLGIAILVTNTDTSYTFGEAVTYGITAAIGFTLALVLFHSIRERLQFSETPQSFEGLPIALVSAALLAMAFMGFSGLKLF